MKRRVNDSLILRTVLSMIPNETHREAAAKTGLSVTTIHRIKSNLANCSVNNLERIMRGYGITHDQLFAKIKEGAA